MFFDRDIKGDRLPPKTICLTYDDGPGDTEGDGPGPHTLELGRYLFEEGIPATFFVIGRHAEGRADWLRQLQTWGHLVANHTYSHPGLVSLTTGGGDVVGEVVRTDDLIREFVPGEVAFLRPPYGNWREKKAPDSPEDKHTSVVAEALNRSGKLAHYVGPVNWDISGHDYDYWRQGASAEDCAQDYLDKFDRLGLGLVLMHDSSDEEALRVNNRTWQMTKIVVPVLKANRYRFVRLDAVPQVRSAVRVSAQVYLRTADGKSLARESPGSDQLVIRGPSEGDEEVFGVVRLGGSQVALRASNGQYLSAPQGDGAEVHATAPEVGAWECLEIEEVGDQQVVFRTANGRYLTRGRNGGDRLLANGTTKRDAEAFQNPRRFGT